MHEYLPKVSSPILAVFEINGRMVAFTVAVRLSFWVYNILFLCDICISSEFQKDFSYLKLATCNPQKKKLEQLICEKSQISFRGKFLE